VVKVYTRTRWRVSFRKRSDLNTCLHKQPVCGEIRHSYMFQSNTERDVYDGFGVRVSEITHITTY
jgi:hypothetical protein